MSCVLTLNAGSSSIKFGVYNAAPEPDLLAVGLVEKLESATPHLVLHQGSDTTEHTLSEGGHDAAVVAILAAVTPVLAGRKVAAVGHRIVHGGPDHSGPARVTPEMLADLERYVPFAPLHQPHNLSAVRAAMVAFPDAVQVGCFDTAFHRGHPFVNDTFALPRRFYDKGVRRYGFHGLSYDFISGELDRIDPDDHHRRTIVCHLGNGASLCAIRGGRSVGSTMGFSALDGLPMGTRCGQIDPGVVLYLLDQEGMTSSEISGLLYKESGLKGMSGLSNDMRELLASDRAEAAQAVDYFVFRIRREIGAMAAVLGGLDTLVFCGGIGENAGEIRAKVCEGMDWLGILLDRTANETPFSQPGGVVSEGEVTVRVLRTDEERIIARAASAALE
ncbi:acetate/propionate family kinase (plasmid) [Rhodobacteraceae bacterium SC52]|nr:acetate/propionate family kinase [Rhodobacteraceae bacterium SC52]